MEFIFSSAIILFFVMDPFGNIPIFTSALAHVAPERRLFVLTRELIIALGLLIMFLLFGKHILSLLHISGGSLHISGGIILFLISLKIVFSDPAKEAFADSFGGEEPFIVPLAIPLVAGPGAMGIVLVLASQHSDKILQMLLAVIVASLLNYAVLMLSMPISRVFGRRGILAMERLAGMLLSILAVDMVMKGILKFI